jgi:cytochrome b6-f complex iron-sulfur subunit
MEQLGTGRVSRRGFLSRLWLIVGGAAVLELLWISVEFLRPGKGTPVTSESGVLVAGPVDDFEPGTVTAFPRGKFYLVRLEDGGFLALHRECTHLGCTVPWIEEERRFLCPCHASSFDATGNVISLPAPRALDLLPIRIENRVVKVDTRSRIRRQAFEAGQVTRA